MPDAPQPLAYDREARRHIRLTLWRTPHDRMRMTEPEWRMYVAWSCDGKLPRTEAPPGMEGIWCGYYLPALGQTVAVGGAHALADAIERMDLLAGGHDITFVQSIDDLDPDGPEALEAVEKGLAMLADDARALIRFLRRGAFTIQPA